MLLPLSIPNLFLALQLCSKKTDLYSVLLLIHVTLSMLRNPSSWNDFAVTT